MVKIREFRGSDVEAYAAIQAEEWGDSMAAMSDQITKRYEIFPEGLIAAEHDGAFVGCLCLIRLSDYDVSDKRSWSDVTADGWCSTHEDDGDVLFGVDLSVSRYAPRLAAPMIFAAAIELSVSLGVRSIIWGARIPRYHKHADNMTAEEYLAARTKRGRFLDPEIEIYSRVPGVRILGPVPEYFEDPESLNYGVMLEVPNPAVRFPFLRPVAKQVVGLHYRRRGLSRPDSGS